jgi:Na+/melibiose symporter-like transporter
LTPIAVEGAAGARTAIDAASGEVAARAASTSDRLPRSRLVAYSTAALAIDMVVVPITAVLPAFYAKHTAASLSAIGVWLVVTMFWDAISDQVIGYVSDRTRSRFGARKPWIVLGALVTSLSVMFLFRPSPDSTVTYFGVWALVFYAGWAMMTIPYTAWGAELSNDYRERSRIVTYRQVAGSLGGLLFLAAPLLLPFESTEMSPQVMSVVAWATLALLPAAVAVTVTLVPAAAPVVTERGVPLHRVILSMLRNRPFQRYLFIFILGAIQLGFYARLLYLFLDSYLKIGDKFSHVMAATAFASWVVIPLWLAIVDRFGKHKPWALSLAASSVVLWAFLFVEPGPGAFWPAIVISCLMAILGGCSAVAPPSLLADIIEYDRLKTGQDRAGNYFAFHLVVVKVAVAISGGVAFLMLDWFGFDPKAVTHDATARAGMLLAFVFLPNLLQLLSVPAVWKFPLDHRTQRIVRRRLEQREARMARAAAAREASAPR